MRAEIRFAPHGTLQHELVKPTAAVRRADAFVALLCLSDWQRGGTFDSAKFDDDLALFVSSLRGAVEQLPFVALVLCPARPSAQQTKFSAAAMTLRALELPRLRVLDARELAGAYAVCEMHDVVADELGHVPYTDEMWCALGAICSRGVLPALAPPLKVVVVDCDYTLWHGAVGELGAAGVSVEPRHAQLQARLIDLRERGVLIALCSRNEEADVWAAFERASGMLLSREHVSAFRIAPALAKGAAVRALCVELRCAAEHVIFVDDNPAEVAAVRAALPAAACWVFPQTHAEAKAQLPHVWRLEVPHAAPSAEDGARAASLAAARAGAASLRRAAPSRAEYHAALGVRIDVSSLADADAAVRERLLQLHERTNQFNTWKRRPPPPAALAAAEGVAIRVADRFADYGLVGAALCARGDGGVLYALSFCMSCRVLGRGVEHAILRALGNLAADAAAETVAVGACAAPRNAPVLAFLRAVAAATPGAREAEGGELCAPAGAFDGAWAEAPPPERWLCFPRRRCVPSNLTQRRTAPPTMTRPTRRRTARLLRRAPTRRRRRRRRRRRACDWPTAFAGCRSS